MIRLDDEQVCAFVQRGWTVVPRIVSKALQAAAHRRIDALLDEQPPPQDRRGFHFYWIDDPADDDPLLQVLTRSPAQVLAQSMIAPRMLERPTQIQVSLNIPPWPHRPGGPHLDGLTPTEPDGRPGTFTMLAGILLTDQPGQDMGNLWVWPGSHQAHAAQLRANGAEALRDMAHPPPVGTPEQIVGRAGDMVLAHYLLGHNMGGNLSDTVRRAIYFRLRSAQHRQEWQANVADPLREFATLRSVKGTWASVE